MDSERFDISLSVDERGVRASGDAVLGATQDEYGEFPDLPVGPPPPPPPTWMGIPAVPWTHHGRRVLDEGVYSYRP